jgi:hypothetical protein
MTIQIEKKTISIIGLFCYDNKQESRSITQICGSIFVKTGVLSWIIICRIVEGYEQEWSEGVDLRESRFRRKHGQKLSL